MKPATKNVLVCPAGGLNTLMRALKCVGLHPVPAPTYRRFVLPAVLPSPRPLLFATYRAREPWLDGLPAAVAVGRMPDGRVRAVWVGADPAEPSGLHQAVGPEARLLRRMYAELACIFHVATAVTAVGGGMAGMAHTLEPDGSKTITFTAFLPGDDPSMSDVMKMPTTVRVTIDPKGKPTIEVVGAQGGSCLTATRQLVDALGSEDKQELKPEFFETAVEESVTATGR